VNLLGDPAVEAQLVLPRQREAGVVGVTVDVVRLDRVEALAGAAVEAVVEDRRQDPDPADVEPAFLWVPLVALALDRLRETAGVGPVALPAADVEVADGPAALPVKLADDLSADVEAVDLVDQRGNRRVDPPLKLPLPGCGRRPRLPAAIGGRGQRKADRGGEKG